MTEEMAMGPGPAEDSQRDVVFTPFMLRVRDAVRGDSTPAVLHFESSRPTGIAVAIDEWFGLRARAEHVICEANAMLDAQAERILLEDEFGTGHLSFTLSWRDRSLRIGVGIDSVHSGHVRTEESSWSPGSQDVKPTDQDFLEDLAVGLVSLTPPEVDVAASEDSKDGGRDE
ncbi:MAG: hypothetical protein ACK5MT_10665 [Actinomycetales bacterium]